MEEIMGKEYTNNCFGKIDKLIKTKNNINENIKIENIFKFIKEDYLIISDEYKIKLKEQSHCLANFLFETYGAEYISFKEDPKFLKNKQDFIEDYYRITSGENYLTNFLFETYGAEYISFKEDPKFLKNKEDFIEDYHRITSGENYYFTLKWNWNKPIEEGNKEHKLPLIKRIFNEDQPEFKKLKECYELLKVHKG
uniref:Uncharacterized protein n=1 Tax=Meloidogyne floridensis TaxID=298350 RepID=A0A915NZC5_9BILA